MAAIASVASVHLIGRAREETNTDESTLTSPELMLQDSRVGAVAVLTRPADREYWVRQAADCGKHVICEHPVVSTAGRAIKLSNHCKENDVALFLVDRFSSESERLLRGSIAEAALGHIVFVEVDVFVPRAWINPWQDGVVLEYGASFTTLLQDCLGPIDTIYARTRSLVTNRPQEDVGVVQLRFKSGVEGTLKINGLGADATVRVAVYGKDHSTGFEVDLRQADAIGLRTSYEEVGAVARGHFPEQAHSADALTESLFLVDWIHQSARNNTEVLRRDARLR